MVPGKPKSARGRGGCPKELLDISAEERALAARADAPYEAHVELQHRKWRFIHKHLHLNPFRVSETLPRGQQWQKVLDHIKDVLPEPELVDWLIQQIDIANNMAAGIRDLRPRKNGPVYDVLMEYVANRKRKAVAIHHWVLAAQQTGQGAGWKRPGKSDADRGQA
jgi:hypothetical protein